MKISNIWRLLRILLIFSRKRNIKAVDIAKEIEISVRQVYRDIESLRLAGIPIYSGKNGFNIVEDFFLPKISLEIPEVLTLFLLCSSIKEQKGTPYSELLTSACDKIFNALPENIKKVFLGFSYEGDIIDFGFSTKVNYEKIDEIFKLVYNATILKKKLKTDYYSLENEQLKERIINPYGLKFYFGIWYLVGFCNLRNEIRTFRIDRIKKAQILDESFELPSNFSIDDYFEDSWGIRKGPKKFVKLLFSKKVANFILECIWHPSQKLNKRKDGSVLAEFKVAGLNEIKIWILGFGEHVKVLEPQELAQDIKNTSLKIHNLYC